MRILVTGGLGFIGKHFVESCLERGYDVTVLDAVTYAADVKMLDRVCRGDGAAFLLGRVQDVTRLPEADVIVNFAAESHVDRSIANSTAFIESNVGGVQRLLDLMRASPGARLVQISTDEVYGDIMYGRHTELDRLAPSNPYAASKAAADMLVMAWGRTYRIPYQIVRLSNCYGMHQYPEKLIPRSAWLMANGRPAELHGDGSAVRSWLHVADACDAIHMVIDRGAPAGVYNVPGYDELTNRAVVRKIAAALDVPNSPRFVTERPGQDVRYAVDGIRLERLGWRRLRKFDECLPEIVRSVDISRWGLDTPPGVR